MRSGRIYLNLGSLANASSALDDAIALLREFGDQQFSGFVIGHRATVCHELGDLERARLLYEEALGLVREAQNPCHMTIAGEFGRLVQEMGHLPEARRYYQESLKGIRAVGDRRYEAIYEGALATVDAEADDIAMADHIFDTCEALAKTQRDPAILATVRLQRAYVDLARCRACLASDDAERAIAMVLQARHRLDRAPNLPLSELRITARLLKKCLGDSSQAVLLMGRGCRWFVPPGKTRPVGMADREAPRRLLLSLAQHRVVRPRDPLPIEKLVEIGWPGERIKPSAAAARVYTAVATLRTRGLQDALLKTENGYLLDPEVPVVLPRDPMRSASQAGR